MGHKFLVLITSILQALAFTLAVTSHFSNVEVNSLNSLSKLRSASSPAFFNTVSTLDFCIEFRWAISDSRSLVNTDPFFRLFFGISKVVLLSFLK
jgi:hypothetical protein